MHILVSEISLSGHHANYLEHIALGFLTQGHRVTVSVREAERSNPVLSNILEAHPAQCRVEALPTPDGIDRRLSWLGVAGRELTAWRAFRRFFKELQRRDPVDRVFYPYIDYCLHAMALLGPPSGNTMWAGICVRPSFHLRHSGVIAPTPAFAVAKERLFRRLLYSSGLLALFTIDESLERYVRQRHPDRATKLQHWPEPASLSRHHTRESARASLGIPPDRFVILVYGGIDERKGIDHLLAGLNRATVSRSVLVVTAGKHAQAVRDLLADNNAVLSFDRYVDSDTEEALFRSADLVWLGYKNHFTASAVLLIAALAGVPVLATHNGLIGWMTRRHELGNVADTSNPEQVALALQEHLAQPMKPATEGMLYVRQHHRWDVANQLIQTAMGH